MIVYNQDQEQRASNGGQDPSELTPSKLKTLNCTTHVEESSEQLEYRSLGPLGGPCSSSQEVAEAENPVCG